MATRRLLAKRLLTNEVLAFDLPAKWTPLRELNAPGGVSGTINADVALALSTDGRPLVQKWSTALYVVEGDTIIAGGPVTSLDDDGAERRFIASGFTSWPEGQPYLDSYGPDDFEEPTTIYRALWSHLQSFADGQLGVQIDAAPTYMIVSNGDGPYTIIQTEYRDVGAEMTNLLSACKIDYVEDHYFTNTATQALTPLIRLGFPRIGGNRHNDLRFAEGENVLSVTEAGGESDDYANDITVLGQGEGYAAVDDGMVQRVYRPDGRARRAIVVSDPSLLSPGQVMQRAEDEYIARRGTTGLESFTIDANHPNAPLPDIGLGDDVIVTYTSPVLGTKQTEYVRILSIEEPWDSPGTAVIGCAPSEDFTYFPATNPMPDGEPYVVQV